jgi:GAF domain-containing protein
MADLEQLRSEAAGPEVLCAKLAEILNVHRDEVALLRVEKNCLRFVFPAELRAAGALPLSGSAVAARTASTQTSLLSNTFIRVRHLSLFESVKLACAEAEEPGSQQMPIQKIMSVPIVGSGERVVGVVQVSRKGLDASLCGPDFTNDDLKQLEKAAALLAEIPFMQDGVQI